MLKNDTNEKNQPLNEEQSEQSLLLNERQDKQPLMLKAGTKRTETDAK
jgi:hypothetical protein